MSLTRTGIPYLDFAWNPCGCGCSMGCDGCWAKRIAPRIGKNIGCKLCASFTPHLHPERLGDPGKRKKPAAIGVQFTGELFDIWRPGHDVVGVLEGIEKSPQHQFVFLTQRVDRARRVLNPKALNETLPPSWFIGCTARNQAEADKRILGLSKIRGRRWTSLEPLHEHVGLAAMGRHLDGVVVGCDNRGGVPFENEWARDALRQCRDAGVPCYIKQIRSEDGRRVLTDPADFPEDLRVRELPWTLRTKKP